MTEKAKSRQQRLRDLNKKLKEQQELRTTTLTYDPQLENEIINETEQIYAGRTKVQFFGQRLDGMRRVRKTPNIFCLEKQRYNYKTMNCMVQGKL